MKSLVTFALLMICLNAMGQEAPHFSSLRLLSSTPLEAKKEKRLTFYPGTYIDTEMLYTVSTGMSVIIQNSLPKGGGHTDPAGNRFGYRLFWTRIISTTDSLLEVTVHFPTTRLELSSNFPTVGSTDIAVHSSSYLQLFLPSDTMTIDKETLYDYGVSHLESFLDSALNRPTMLKRIIKPGEPCLFYVGMVLYKVTGNVRGELVLKGRELFYRISGVSPELDVQLIPCGQIVVDR